MAVKSSGQLSFNSDIVGEFGGSAPHALSEYKRGGSLVPNGPSANADIPTTNSDIQFSDFYGSVNQFQYTFSSNTANVNLQTTLTSAGWDGSSPVEITISNGVWIYGSGSTGLAYGGLLIGSVFTDKLTIINNGVIAGQGGKGGDRLAYGENGGPAIYNFAKNVNITNNGYIAGGGGGGAGGTYGGGGGGAGGGAGGNGYYLGTRAGGAGGSIGNAGATGSEGKDTTRRAAGGGAGGGGADQTSWFGGGGGGGGGGGRILPGTGGLGGLCSSGGSNMPGGHGGSANNAGSIFFFTSDYSTCGGGGGWGAAGGGIAGGNQRGGGSGGKAIVPGGSILNRGTVNLTNNGTIYGATS